MSALRLLMLLLTLAPAWSAVGGVTLTVPYVAPQRIVMCQRNWPYALGPQTGSQNYGMYAIWHGSAPCVFSNIQFVYGNYNTGASGDVVGANSITITPSVDFFFNGYQSRTVLTFSSASPVTITAGSTVISDALFPTTWTTNPGFEFRELCFMNGGVSGTWPLSNVIFNNSTYENQQIGVATADQSAGGFNFHAPGDPYGAMYIIGTPSCPMACYLGVGDSVMVGFGDTSPSVISGAIHAYAKGWMERAIGTTCALINTAVSSTTAAQWVANDRQYTMAGTLTQYCTHAIVGLGINDIGTNGSSAATVESLITSICNTLHTAGIKHVYGTTFQPNTTSTDSWATTANQTVYSFEAVRVAVNTWTRGGAGGAEDGYLEVCIPSESSPGSGKWAVNGTANYYTSDGLHHNSTASAAVATSIAPSINYTP